MTAIARARWPSLDGLPTIADAGMLLHLLLEAADAVLHRGHRRVVDDQHLAVAADVLRPAPGRRAARPGRCRWPRARRPCRRCAAMSAVNTGMPARSGPARCGPIGVRVARRGEDRRDALRDEVLDLRRLPGRVHLAGDDHQVQAAAAASSRSPSSSSLKNACVWVRSETPTTGCPVRGRRIAGARHHAQDHQDGNKQSMSHPVGS